MVERSGISTTHGNAITAHATITTSESPKLYSDRPATRNPTIAAMLPTTSARSLVASAGSRRSRPIARVKNATQMASYAARPSTPRSTSICSGVLCTCPVRFFTASGSAWRSYTRLSSPGPTPSTGCSRQMARPLRHM